MQQRSEGHTQTHDGAGHRARHRFLISDVGTRSAATMSPSPWMRCGNGDDNIAPAFLPVSFAATVQDHVRQILQPDTRASNSLRVGTVRIARASCRIRVSS